MHRASTAHSEAAEPLREELPQKSLGGIETLELIVAKAENFIPPELEIPVSGDHVRVLAYFPLQEARRSPSPTSSPTPVRGS